MTKVTRRMFAKMASFLPFGFLFKSKEEKAVYSNVYGPTQPTTITTSCPSWQNKTHFCWRYGNNDEPTIHRVLDFEGKEISGVIAECDTDTGRVVFDITRTSAFHEPANVSMDGMTKKERNGISYKETYFQAPLTVEKLQFAEPIKRVLSLEEEQKRRQQLIENLSNGNLKGATEPSTVEDGLPTPDWTKTFGYKGKTHQTWWPIADFDLMPEWKQELFLKRR